MVCQNTGIQSQISQNKSFIQNIQTWATNITHLYLHEDIKSKVWISFAAPTKWNYFKLLELNIYGKAVTWIQNMTDNLFPHIFPGKLK